MKFTIAAVAALTILLAVAFITTANEGTDYPFWSGSHVDTVMDSQYVRDRVRNPQGIHVTETRIYILDVWDSGRILSRKGAIRAFDRDTQMEIGGESFFLAEENRFPVDITSDGTTMWIVDSSYIDLSSTIYPEIRFNTGKVYAYNIATKMRDTSKEFRITPASRPQGDEYVPGDFTSPSSICTDGVTIWVRTSIVPEPPLTLFHTAEPARQVLVAFSVGTLEGDACRDVTIEKGGGAIETDGETVWVTNGTTQWDTYLEAYSIATNTRDTSKDFGGFPDFSTDGAGLFGSLSITGMSLNGNALYALSRFREEVYVIGHNPQTATAVPTQRSMDTSWILHQGYEDDYP